MTLVTLCGRTESAHNRAARNRGRLLGMPLVNYDRMFRAMTAAHGGWNEIKWASSQKRRLYCRITVGPFERLGTGSRWQIS